MICAGNSHFVGTIRTFSQANETPIKKSEYNIVWAERERTCSPDRFLSCQRMKKKIEQETVKISNGYQAGSP